VYRCDITCIAQLDDHLPQTPPHSEFFRINLIVLADRGGIDWCPRRTLLPASETLLVHLCPTKVHDQDG
ncbi:uncharacterized protein METZ01_LOCUS175212, partial [marine metagenome]